MADYELYRGGELIASLTRTDGDFPWHEGEAITTADFDVVRPLFRRELALLDEDRIEEWEVVWDEIKQPGLILRPLDGRGDITEFLIHFEDQQAWWRY